MYEIGNGVPSDLSEAKRWYQKSAEKDFKDAQAKLAEFYAKGIGMEQPDLIEAYVWYTLATPPFGQESSIVMEINTLRVKMTKEQLTLAEKRLDSYRKQFRASDMSAAKDDFKNSPPLPKKQAD
jgi:TPR repeat protein